MSRDAARLLDLDPDVGRVADSVIAARHGISRKTVLAWRKRKGVPAFDDPFARGPSASAPQAPAARVAAPVRTATPPDRDPIELRRAKPSRLDAFLGIIGRLPDRAVAEQAGVSPENVRMYRQRRGIDANWRAGETPPTRVELALAAVERDLGTLPDAVIAKRAGVSRSAVTQYRARKGIAAGRRAVPDVVIEPGVGFEILLHTASGTETVTIIAANATAAIVAAAQHGEVLQLRRIGRVV